MDSVGLTQKNNKRRDPYQWLPPDQRRGHRTGRANSFIRFSGHHRGPPRRPTKAPRLELLTYGCLGNDGNDRPSLKRRVLCRLDVLEAAYNAGVPDRDGELSYERGALSDPPERAPVIYQIGELASTKRTRRMKRCDKKGDCTLHTIQGVSKR